jgi:hypothetical protein
MLAGDGFTVETVRLQTLEVLYFIEMGSRRVDLAGGTTSPDRVWVTQPARPQVWHLNHDPQPVRFLIPDRDTQFSATFDSLLVSESVKIVRTPFRAPKANATAERRVRSVREA